MTSRAARNPSCITTMRGRRTRRPWLGEARLVDLAATAILCVALCAPVCFRRDALNGALALVGLVMLGAVLHDYRMGR